MIPARNHDPYPIAGRGVKFFLFWKYPLYLVRATCPHQNSPNNLQPFTSTFNQLKQQLSEKFKIHYPCYKITSHTRCSTSYLINSSEYLCNKNKPSHRRISTPNDNSNILFFFFFLNTNNLSHILYFTLYKFFFTFFFYKISKF